MEQIQWCITDEVYSCIPDDSGEILGGDYEKWVFKAFKEKKYNQLEVDPRSCFVVSPFQAISNFTGKYIWYDLMRSTFSRLKNDGKFVEWVGGKMTDGMEYAIRAYNNAFEDTLKYKVIPLTVNSIVESLKNGSPVVCFIKYSKTTFKDEADNAWIDSVESIWDMGHCIQIIKLNTQDDILGKYLENYSGKIKNDIIGFDFTKFRKLFGNTGLQIYR